MFDWLTGKVYLSYSQWGFIEVTHAIFNEAEDRRMNAFIAEHEALHLHYAQQYSIRQMKYYGSILRNDVSTGH